MFAGKYRKAISGQIEAFVFKSKLRSEGARKLVLDRRMYRNIYFWKPRTRSIPTRIPDKVEMSTYMMVR